MGGKIDFGKSGILKRLNGSKSNRVLAMKGEDIIDLDITEALDMPRVFDEKLYEIAKDLSR
jgi:6-phosphofructokinase 1